MKLRQKLAVLLAASMIATAMPVVTMASSDYKIVSGIKYAEKDDTISNALKVEMKDVTDQPFMFFVNIANAEFPSDLTGVNTGVSLSEVVGGIDVKYTTVKDGKEMKVEVTPTGLSKATIILPLNVKLKGGDATVAVDAAGSYGVSDYSATIFAKTTEKKASITVSDAKTIYGDDAKVAKISIEEPFVNILKKDSKKLNSQSNIQIMSL